MNMWVVCGCECVCVCVCAGGVCYVVYIGWRQCQFHVSAGYSPWKQACLRACQQRRTWKVLLRSFSSYETSCRVFRHRTRTLCKLIGPHSHRSIYGGGGGSHNHRSIYRGSHNHRSIYRGSHNHFMQLELSITVGYLTSLISYVVYNNGSSKLASSIMVNKLNQDAWKQVDNMVHYPK